MTKKIVYVPREEWSIEHLHYWKKNNKWHCAVPRDDWMTQMGLGWKTHGLIGVGNTKKEAAEDWEKWKIASDFVADIY